MVELLSAGMTGDNFSYEAGENDNNDGGPPKGGELVIAINPELVAGVGWADHSEGFFQKLEGLEGIRVPGERRHKNRLDLGARNINKELLGKLRDLLEATYP
jgi:delta1-piperideine-2-carboxylate reductase